MWISVVGAEGTCKSTVAEFLKKDEGFRLAVEIEDEDISEASGQISILLSRYELQYEDLQKNMNDEDIVQIRSFWDTYWVYSKVLLVKDCIKPSDFKLHRSLYRCLEKTLVPPHMVFYCYASNIHSLNRIQLAGKKSHHDEWLSAVRDAYDKYVKNLRISVIELDVSRPFDQVKDDIRIGISSVKSVDLTGGSIWKRTMMKVGVH